MDGLLIVDKPSGPTSHDVVSRVRRAIAEQRVGHTGTLDPLASGVLPLVIGRATRLAQLLSGSDKEYVATIDLGQATDTHDVQGQPIGTRWNGPPPARSEIEAALNRFRGTFLQQPPVFSAKKIGGRRSYRIARAGLSGALHDRHEATETASRPPAPVQVTAHEISLLEFAQLSITVRLRCSAGFYVRSLAHDIGQTLGTGASLTALRRTESAGARIDMAMPLERLDQGGAAVAIQALIPMEQIAPAIPAVALTGDGVVHARCGRDLTPMDTPEGFPADWEPEGCPPHVRLLDESGRLVGLARPASTRGLLHPAVILM
jgi:tRNA pseudouridine55 synthase